MTEKKKRNETPFSVALTRARLKTYKSMRQTAKDMGFAIASYTAWEHGTSMPIPVNFKRVVEYFKKQPTVSAQHVVDLCTAYEDTFIQGVMKNE